VAGAEPGFYGAAYISGIITEPIAAGTLAIKQTNEALRLYKGRTGSDIVTEKPSKPPVPSAANIWIPAADANDTPFKWKVYVDASSKAPKLDSGAFGVLLWDGGASGTSSAPYSNKKAVLEVESASFDADDVADVDDGLFRRYIIDYSGVKFDLADLYPLVERDGTNGTAAIGNAENLDTSAIKTIKEDGTPVITITLTNTTGKTFTGTTDFTSNHNVWGAKPSGNTVTGNWADIAVDLKLALDAVATGKTLSVKQTSQALNYYTGAGDLLSSAPTAPSTSTSGDNIWIPSDSTPVKWKTYASSVSPNWGIILWNGASSKTVKLEIFQHDNSSNPGAGTLVSTVVIDYSGLTITPPASSG
jgi:hypothetical protein